MTNDSEPSVSLLPAGVIAVGSIVPIALTSVWLFGASVEHGPLQIATTLGLSVAVVVMMFGGYSAADLSGAMSKGLCSDDPLGPESPP